MLRVCVPMPARSMSTVIGSCVPIFCADTVKRTSPSNALTGEAALPLTIAGPV